MPSRSSETGLHAGGCKLAAIFTAGILAVVVPSGAAVAQSVYTEDATITATGATITGQYLPIAPSSGPTAYYNFTTTITPNTSGPPTATTVFTPSPSFLKSAGAFQAGTYYCDGYNATLSGPGIGPGGTAEWTWTSGNSPNNAVWYAGAISKNPFASRIKKAGITYAGNSYGISGAGEANWASNCLIGAAQTGNAISLFSFSNNGCTQDNPIALAQESCTLETPH